MYCLRQLPRAAVQPSCTATQEHSYPAVTSEHIGGLPTTACTTEAPTTSACVIAFGTTLTLRPHAGSIGYTAHVIADGSVFVLTASLAAAACAPSLPAPPAGADLTAAAGAGRPVASASGAACAPGAPVCSQRTALRVTTADGAWVQADTSGAITMVRPPLPGPPAATVEKALASGPSRAWRAVLPGGAVSQGWADGRARVLHPSGCASLRLPRGWGLGGVSGLSKGFCPPAGDAAAKGEVSAQDAAAICGWAAALLSGTAWPPRADPQSDASPEPDSSQSPSKLAPLPASVWVRTNATGQRWAELDPLEALAIEPSTPLPPPPPPGETPPQPVVLVPGASAKPVSGKAGASQSARAALLPSAGEAPGASAKPAGEGKAADGKAQAAGAAAPRRSLEPRRLALQAAPAQDAPADSERPPPPPRLLLLPPVPTESAMDADTGCHIRARADGVLALAYPNGDRLVQDADGARVKFTPVLKVVDPSKSPADAPAAAPESWVAEAAGCPAVCGSAAAIQARTRALLTIFTKTHVHFACYVRTVMALCCLAASRLRRQVLKQGDCLRHTA